MAIGRRKLDDRLGKLAWDFEIGYMVLEDRVRTDSGDWENQQRNVENDKFRCRPNCRKRAAPCALL